MGHTVETVMI